MDKGVGGWLTSRSITDNTAYCLAALYDQQSIHQYTTHTIASITITDTNNLFGPSHASLGIWVQIEYIVLIAHL